ncbi:dipeptide/oligopeptide/nickel ABC transporter permease/ATP-binding protein [Mycolicibacterium sp.]|uniref:dipeptide/oligopeptide/nickel ABC transporter permease/ATP-binding protein n=1 Tax=Mycolicibacterium sp. TaxID=2320850 RepID=UPI0037CCC22D
MTSAHVTPDIAGQAPAPGSPGFLRRLIRRRSALCCLIFLALVVLAGMVSPFLFPDVPYQHAGDLDAVRQLPSLAHPLGTDTLGRDVLQRLLVGANVTLLGVVQALLVVLVVGVPCGLAAGYFGGRFDRVAMWISDIVFSIPGVVVVLMVLSILRQSMTAAMVTFGLLITPIMLRVVRAAVLPVRQELYIAAARVSGLSHPYIIRHHVLPRVAGPIIVQAALLAAMTLLVQTGLSFLGLLVKAPAPSWGGMVADGVSVLILQPWLIWPPGLAIAATVLALSLLGDSIRDAMTEGWSGAGAGASRAARTPEYCQTRLPAEAKLAPESALLTVSGLQVSFGRPDGSRVQVVDYVSFHVKAGETVGLVGESGCGKSATVMAVLGLLPRTGEIDDGRIVFAGQNLVDLSDSDRHALRGKRIGLVSQEPMVAFDPTFRIGAQIMEVVRTHHRLNRSEAYERTLSLLQQVNLPDPVVVARAYPHELSGGMAQRVAIARALAGEPELLIADEPTTALDVTVQAEILDLLRTLQRERGMSIVLITHDWGVVADLCDRAVVLYAGQVVERGELGEIFRAPRHPYTRALHAANPHGAHAESMLPTIGGSVPQPGSWPTGCHFASRCEFVTDGCRRARVDLSVDDADHAVRCIRHAELERAR